MEFGTGLSNTSHKRFMTHKSKLSTLEDEFFAKKSVEDTRKLLEELNYTETDINEIIQSLDKDEAFITKDSLYSFFQEQIEKQTNAMVDTLNQGFGSIPITMSKLITEVKPRQAGYYEMPEKGVPELGESSVKTIDSMTGQTVPRVGIMTYGDDEGNIEDTISYGVSNQRTSWHTVQMSTCFPILFEKGNKQVLVHVTINTVEKYPSVFTDILKQENMQGAKATIYSRYPKETLDQLLSSKNELDSICNTSDFTEDIGLSFPNHVKAIFDQKVQLSATLKANTSPVPKSAKTTLDKIKHATDLFKTLSAISINSTGKATWEREVSK